MDTNKYFFNNQYYDDIIMNKFISNKFKNFYYSLKDQKHRRGFKRYFGKMSDFKIDRSLNVYRANNLIQSNAYSYRLNTSIIPCYNKDRFLDRFHYNEPIDMNTIISDNAFNGIVLCQIDTFFFFGMKFIETPDSTYLIIEPNRFKGMSEEKLSELIANDTTWCIYIQNKVNTYYSYKSAIDFKQACKLNADRTKYVLNIASLFKNLTPKLIPTTVEWDLYISGVSNDENLMIGTHDTNYLIHPYQSIEVDKEFIDSVSDNISNCKLYLISDYLRSDFKIMNITNNTFDVHIPYDTNLISVNNINIFEYDAINHIKKKLLKVNGTTKLATWYTFEIVLEEGETLPENVYIEWFEYDNTTSEFSDVMKHLIDCYGESFIDKYKNGDFCDAVMNYSYTEIPPYDHESFLQYIGYPDLREFRLNRLISTLHDNYMLYKDLSEEINSKNKRSIRHEYLESKFPHVFSRSVMSNENEITDPNNLVSFNEPMMYIIVHVSSSIKPSAILFLNGKRINTERIHVSQNYAYIYMKRSHLKPNIDNLLDIEVFLYDTNKENKKEYSVTFNYTGIPSIIEEDNLFGKIDINNLMIYDKQTKAYLTKDEIGFSYALDSVMYNTSTGEPIEFISDNSDVDFFMTSNNEYFKDDTDTYLMVRHDTIVETMPISSNKILDSSRLMIVLLSSQKINRELVVTNINNYRKTYYKDATLHRVIHMKNFRDYPDKDRFRVYYAGKLLNDTECVLTLPSKYGDDVSLSLIDISAKDTDREIIIEYLPVNEQIVYCGVTDESIFHDGLLWLDNLSYVILADEMRVYINGYRLTSSKISDIGTLNVFMIDNLKIGDYLQIYIPAKDEYIYDLANAKLINNAEIKENIEFREYLKRYHKRYK